MSADLLALAEALTVAVAKLRRARMQTKASKSLTLVVGAGFKVQQVAVLKALAGYRTRWPIVPVEESAALREASVDPMTVALVNALTASGMPLQEAIETAAGQMFVDAAKLQATLFDFNPDTAWTLKHPQAVEYVKFAGANAITNINDTTRKGIQDLIEQAVEDGWSYNQTAGAIRQYFDGFTAPQPQKHIPDRATLVAVTEVGTAYESGARALIDEMASAGFEMQKSQLTAGDDRTSEGCRQNESAGWIPYDDNFPSGNQIVPRFPSCRCSILYRRKPTLR